MSDAFGLNGTVSVASDDNNAAADTGDTSPDYEANETTDYYLAFGDVKSVTDVIADDAGIELPEVSVYQNDLSDLDRLLDEFENAHPQAKLWLVYSLAKSSFGDRQAAENPKMLGAGLDNSGDSEAYPKPLPNDPEAEQFRYADVYRDLPTIETEGLDSGEQDNFESMGVDPDTLGFREEAGPHIPVIEGERLPIAAPAGDEGLDVVQKTIDLIAQLPDEPGTAGGSEAGDDADESADDEGDSDDETIFCRRPTSTGNPCRKEVDSPDEACSWHDPDEPRLDGDENPPAIDADDDVDVDTGDEADDEANDDDADEGADASDDDDIIVTLLKHDEEVDSVQEAMAKAKKHDLM